MPSPQFFTEPHLISGLDKSSPILLGLSGGADSSALLHLLCAYRETANCTVFAAHVNHGIRGESYGNEADRDESFCRELCRKLGVKLFVKKLDIPSMSKASGESLETEARNARYACFAEIMRENGIKILATAHNADDNLETQISNLARGCGISGMIGIPERRELADGTGSVIRPLLKAEKSDIIEYCAENGIEYVSDSTNFETDCTRNKIRHKIIPELLSLYPSAKRSALRLSNSAKEDSEFILGEAKKFLDNHGGKIPLSELKMLHPAPAKRVIMLAFAMISDATLEEIHISEIFGLFSSRKNGSSVSLPDRKRASAIDGYLELCDDRIDGRKANAYRQYLSFGINKIESTPFAVFIGDAESNDDADGYKKYAEATVKNTPDALYAKNRTSGDIVTDGGVNKKIKKLMCDKKVPLSDRDIMPIICSGEEIIYIPLCAVSDKVKLKGSDPHLHITVYKKSEEDNEQ